MLHCSLSCNDTCKDLRLIVSNNITWDKHYEYIIARAYKILGLIRRTFSVSQYSLAKAKLYTTLVRSQLTYCTQLWSPHLMKDILNIERVQRCATIYVLNDYVSDYKTRLFKLKLLPLMYFLSFKILCLLSNHLNFLLTILISETTSPLVPPIQDYHQAINYYICIILAT